jgi:L-lysine 6-transaminase
VEATAMSTLARPISAPISPTEVHDSLRRHMLVDGFPLVLDLERSSGAWIYDSRTGRRLLDMFTSYSTLPLGYNHPGFAEPTFRDKLLASAVNKPSNSDLYSTQMAEFVAALARTVPAPLDRHMFFIEGGALAVENALKTAFDWKVRRNMAAGRREIGHRVIHFERAFHGRSGYTMTLTNTDPRKTDLFPKFPDWPRIPNPKLSFPITPEVLTEVEAAERQAVAEIERQLASAPHEIAALIIEPIQGEGGDNHFRGEFLAELRRLADEGDFLLIFDEIQTGFGTTGRWWCFEHFDVVPDIFAFGKKTQVCGICAGPRIDDVESVFALPSRINSTWGGNLVDMVRCQRIVEIVEQEDLLDNARTVGRQLLSGFEELARRFDGRISNARGRGMFVAFDLPDKETRNRGLRQMAEAGVLALPSGNHAIRFRPALNLTAEEAEEALRRTAQALEATL